MLKSENHFGNINTKLGPKFILDSSDTLYMHKKSSFSGSPPNSLVFTIRPIEKPKDLSFNSNPSENQNVLLQNEEDDDENNKCLF